MTNRHLDARIPRLRARGILTSGRDAAPEPAPAPEPQTWWLVTKDSDEAQPVQVDAETSETVVVRRYQDGKFTGHDARPKRTAWYSYHPTAAEAVEAIRERLERDLQKITEHAETLATVLERATVQFQVFEAKHPRTPPTTPHPSEVK